MRDEKRIRGIGKHWGIRNEVEKQESRKRKKRRKEKEERRKVLSE